MEPGMAAGGLTGVLVAISWFFWWAEARGGFSPSNLGLAAAVGVVAFLLFHNIRRRI